MMLDLNRRGAHDWQRALTIVPFLAVAVAAISLPWSASLAAPVAPSPIVQSEFIFTAAPFPSCHASTIAETQGQLVAAWFGGTAERNPDVGIWLSHREGDAWTRPVEVANGVQSPTLRYPTWNPVLFQPKSGPLMLFYKVGPSPSEWWGMVMTSTDAGHTWSKPKRLPDGVLGPIKNKPIQLPSGDILAGSSTEHDGWRVHFERSTDGGKTWTATAPLNDPDKIAAIQPSILVHKNGKLQAVGRTRSSGIFTIWSEDNGKTWGEMGVTGLPNPSSGTDAVTLADGRQLLVYNHNPNYKGRTPLNVALSDDGKNWLAAAVLEDDPEHPQYSYPAVTQTADGLVHITYTWRRERIKHVALRLDLLKPQPIVDGAWPAAIGQAAQGE
jgi:predicted neuraminidase